MNIYTLKFKATCPVDKSVIDYDWKLHTPYVFMAEELRRIVDGFGEALHENMADALHDRFGGQQRLVAIHAGDVHIETIRPAFVHWARVNKQQEPV